MTHPRLSRNFMTMSCCLFTYSFCFGRSESNRKSLSFYGYASKKYEHDDFFLNEYDDARGCFYSCLEIFLQYVPDLRHVEVYGFIFD